MRGWKHDPTLGLAEMIGEHQALPFSGEKSLFEVRKSALIAVYQNIKAEADREDKIKEEAEAARGGPDAAEKGLTLKVIKKVLSFAGANRRASETEKLVFCYAQPPRRGDRTKWNDPLALTWNVPELDGVRRHVVVQGE